VARSNLRATILSDDGLHQPVAALALVSRLRSERRERNRPRVRTAPDDACGILRFGVQAAQAMTAPFDLDKVSDTDYTPVSRTRRPGQRGALRADIKA
jgi:hypothetical protein